MIERQNRSTKHCHASSPSVHAQLRRDFIERVNESVARGLRALIGIEYFWATVLGATAVQRRPRSVATRERYIMALTKAGRYKEAERRLEHFKNLALPNDYFFLQGFLRRSQGHKDAAIDSFQSALHSGRLGISINRELATCYFFYGDLDNARKYIEAAQLL